MLNLRIDMREPFFLDENQTVGSREKRDAPHWAFVRADETEPPAAALRGGDDSHSNHSAPADESRQPAAESDAEICGPLATGASTIGRPQGVGRQEAQFGSVVWKLGPVSTTGTDRAWNLNQLRQGIRHRRIPTAASRGGLATHLLPGSRLGSRSTARRRAFGGFLRSALAAGRGGGRGGAASTATVSRRPRWPNHQDREQRCQKLAGMYRALHGTLAVSGKSKPGRE